MVSTFDPSTLERLMACRLISVQYSLSSACADSGTADESAQKTSAHSENRMTCPVSRLQVKDERKRASCRPHAAPRLRAIFKSPRESIASKFRNPLRKASGGHASSPQ